MFISSLIIYQLVIFAAAVLQGITGFGFAVIAAPILLFVFKPVVLVVSFIVISFVLNGYLFVSLKTKISTKFFPFLLVGALIGTPLGYGLLQTLNQNVVKTATGVFILIFIIMLNFKNLTIPFSRALTFFVGVVVGSLQTSIGVNGPPLVLYFSTQKIPRISMRRTLAAIFFFISILSLPLVLSDINTNIPHLLLGASAIPAVIAGAKIGKLTSRRINDKSLRKITLIIVAVSAITLLLSVTNPHG